MSKKTLRTGADAREYTEQWYYLEGRDADILYMLDRIVQNYWGIKILDAKIPYDKKHELIDFMKCAVLFKKEDMDKIKRWLWDMWW